MMDMSDAHVWNDDELMDRLGEALRAAEAVPPDFIAMGKATFAWRGIDAELAELTFDSARHEEDPMARTRAETASLRAMIFRAETLRITIDLGFTEDAVQGQLAPPRPGEAHVTEQAGPTFVVPIDDLGGFTVRPRPTSPFRLLLRTTGTALDVVTDWI
jgi:hypothetical protein